MRIKINWHALGISATLICAIHCAIAPLLLSSLPLFGVNIIENIWIELLLLATAFVIGITTFWHGYKKHHHKLVPISLFSIGIFLFIIHQLIKLHYSVWILVLPGVTAIISAHILNYRLCRKANHCHTQDCDH
ncbi:MAG: MerC domain-containing protein [Bacteroidota bacterium]